jgi:hypothetical protein
VKKEIKPPQWGGKLLKNPTVERGKRVANVLFIHNANNSLEQKQCRGCLAGELLSKVE